ncbi:MAG: SCO family protein [Gemmatimonadetes bacterium]|nr:SCO family protein [Gemmatimonadota bacterium]MYD26792.1 SCO family protein [Gemmatimonadota bacterium]MYI99895.1 SCO family protein [Gemmatimonadota bacterium]
MGSKTPGYLPTITILSGLATLVAAGLLLFPGCRAEPPPPPQIDIPELLDYGERFGGDFMLTDQEGERFDLSEHRGDAFLIFFGYTYCPDACPLMLSKLAAVYDVLDLEPGQRVRTIYVTVDPRRDTPKQLGDYLAYFSTVDVRGLTGSREEIDAVAEWYGVLYKLQEPNEAGHYLVAHTTTLFLVDREGRLRYRFHPSDTPEYIAAGIKLLFE